MVDRVSRYAVGVHNRLGTCGMIRLLSMWLPGGSVCEVMPWMGRECFGLSEKECKRRV